MRLLKTPQAAKQDVWKSFPAMLEKVQFLGEELARSQQRSPSRTDTAGRAMEQYQQKTPSKGKNPSSAVVQGGLCKGRLTALCCRQPQTEVNASYSRAPSETSDRAKL